MQRGVKRCCTPVWSHNEPFVYKKTAGRNEFSSNLENNLCGLPLLPAEKTQTLPTPATNVPKHFYNL